MAAPATRSLVCVLTWVFRLSGRLKEAEQKEQVKGCLPEWEATCRLLALESEKVFLQSGQSYGFSPLGNTGVSGERPLVGPDYPLQ